MSRGSVGGADACIKAFAMEKKIQSCPFICPSFEQLTGMGPLFDKCIVLRHLDDSSLEKLNTMLSSIFPSVQEVCYNSIMNNPYGSQKKISKKLSTISEE